MSPWRSGTRQKPSPPWTSLISRCVEARKRRFVGGMQPPVRATTAGTRDRTAVDNAQPALHGHAAFGANAFEQGASDAAEPIGRSAQALQKSNIRKARNIIHPGPGRSRAQAHPTGAIGQRQAQQCCCVRNIATAHERSCRPRRRLKINGLRQPRYQSLPVCLDRIIRLHPAEESHLDSTSLPLS